MPALIFLLLVVGFFWADANTVKGWIPDSGLPLPHDNMKSCRKWASQVHQSDDIKVCASVLRAIVYERQCPGEKTDLSRCWMAKVKSYWLDHFDAQEAYAAYRPVSRSDWGPAQVVEGPSTPKGFYPDCDEHQLEDIYDACEGTWDFEGKEIRFVKYQSLPEHSGTNNRE